MSTPEPQWNADTPPSKSSKRKLWWILGCAGFAVLGLMVLGVVATVVLPNWVRHNQVAREAKIRVDLTAVHAAVEEYKLNHNGTYPTSLTDLGAVGLKVPRDPWDHDYVLVPGEDLKTRPRLFSYGRDGTPGGLNDDADVEFTPR